MELFIQYCNMNTLRKLYVKNGQSILADPSNMFVYQTLVYANYKGYCSLCNSQYHTSTSEIDGVVGVFNKTPHIQICSELFAAPEFWLIENGFSEYIKPDKTIKSTTKNK